MRSRVLSLLLLLTAGAAAALYGPDLWRRYVRPLREARPDPSSGTTAQGGEGAPPGTTGPADPTDLDYWREQVRKVAARGGGEAADAGTPVRQPGAAVRSEAGPSQEVRLAGRPECRERAEAAWKQFQEGEVSRAESAVRAMLAQDPGCASAHVLLGQVYYQRNELAAAIEQWETARRLAPDDPGLDPRIAKAKREMKVEDKLGQRDSSNFTVSFDGRDDRDAAYAAVEILEEARGVVGRAFDFFPADPVPVILYPGQTFQETGRPAWSDGLYDGKIRLASSGAQQHPARFRQVLYHEYTHALVHRIAAGRPVPAWVNEGLAQYVETLVPGARSRDTVPARAGSKVPLTLLHGSFSRLDARAADLAYTEARLAVAELIQSYRLYRLRELLERIGQGRSFGEAFEDTFPLTYEAFAKKRIEP